VLHSHNGSNYFIRFQILGADTDEGHDLFLSCFVTGNACKRTKIPENAIGLTEATLRRKLLINFNKFIPAMAPIWPWKIR
jgi:hypothetical protein